MTARVLFVTGEYPPLRGGVADYTDRLRHALAERGWAVDVATRSLPDRPGEDPSVRWRLADWGRSLWRTMRALRRSGWRGIVHLQYQAGAFDLQGRIALLPILARPLPVVTTFHDTRVPFLFPKAGPLRHAVLRLLARTSAAVVITNPEDDRELRRWGVVPERRVLIPIGSNLPEPRDPERARARLDLPLDRSLVAFFGFRQREKGLDTLLAALSALPEPRPVLLLLGGAQPDVPGARSAAPAGMTHAAGVPVLDLGYQPAQDVADLLAAADAVVLPFRRGASLRHGTLIAAVTCGAPVVTTCPSDPLLLTPLRDGEHLRLVPPDDASALAAVLGELLSDVQMRERLRAGARAVASSFAWERIAAAHEQLYHALVAGPSVES